MFQYSRNSNFKKIISSPFIVLLFLILTISAAYGALNIFLKRISLENNLETLNKKIDALEAKNMSIAKKMEYINSETGIEKEAKARLNLKKEGEQVIVVIPPKDNTQNNSNENNSIFKKIKNWLNF